MRPIAVLLALLLGFAAPVAYAADLEPMVTKAPVYKAPPPEPVFEAPPWILLVPLGVLIAACVTDICQTPQQSP